MNRSIRDRVLNMESESRNHVKHYWKERSEKHAEKIGTELIEYKKKIEKLHRVETELERKEKEILGSLEMTQSAAKHEQLAFQTMSAGIRSIR